MAQKEAGTMRKAVLAVSLIVAMAGGVSVFAAGSGTTSGTTTGTTTGTTSGSDTGTPPPDNPMPWNMPDQYRNPAHPVEGGSDINSPIPIENAPVINP